MEDGRCGDVETITASVASVKIHFTAADWQKSTDDQKLAPNTSEENKKHSEKHEGAAVAVSAHTQVPQHSVEHRHR